MAAEYNIEESPFYVGYIYNPLDRKEYLDALKR
jgi:hypothetical protein